MHYEVSLDQIADINTHRKALNKQHAALVIIEMQNIFSGEIISDKQISHVKQLIAFADQYHIKKIFVRHNDSSQTSENMIQWWGGDQIVKGSQEWQIMSEFDLSNAEVVDKSQYSAFYQTNLDEILKECQIEDVIICGVMTNCCCETTTRDAFMHGYNVFFVSDATATVSADLHLAAIKNIAFGFAQVINTQEFISMD